MTRAPARTAALIGAGNIGYRHFQALIASQQIDRILVVERSPERRAFIQTSPEAQAATKEIMVGESLELLRPRGESQEPLSLLISALTTDIQFALLGELLTLKPLRMLLEKPLAQSQAQLDQLLSSARQAGLEGQIRVNCGRNLGAGVGKIREHLAQSRAETRDESRFHLEVFGNGWGLGCNMLHFTELFRFMTNAREIRPVSSQIAISPFGNKRGAQYEEFLGTVAFTSDQGDSLQITCGGESRNPSSISLLVSDRRSDKALYLIEEKPRSLTDLVAMKKGPLGDLFVAESTRAALDLWPVQGAPSDRLPLPTLEQIEISQRACLGALELGLGRRHFNVT